MPFISEADLKVAILNDELREIVRNDTTVILQAISAAESAMRGYLYNSYDVDAIFSTTGENRHPLLVQYAADLAVYFLVAATQGGQAVDDRRDRYDRACRWLKMVRDDDHYADLPRRVETVETKIFTGQSGSPKRNNYF